LIIIIRSAFFNCDCGGLVSVQSQLVHGTTCQEIIICCEHNGCNVGFKRKWKEKHEENCNHMVINCVNRRNGCGFRAKRKDFFDHDCEFRIYKCICGMELLLKDSAEHRKNCMELEAECRGRKYGCSFVDKKKFLSQHEENCGFATFSDIVRKVETENNQLQEENVALKQQNERLLAKVNELENIIQKHNPKNNNNDRYRKQNNDRYTRTNIPRSNLFNF